LTTYGAIVGHDNANYPGPAAGVRGNVTTIAQWLNTTGSWVNTAQLAYDVAGNLVSSEDANGHTASFWYNDNYPDGNRNTYAINTVASNALGQVYLQVQSDYSTGFPNVTADIRGAFSNNYRGTSGYALDRLVQHNSALSTAAQSSLNYNYVTTNDIQTFRDQRCHDAGLPSVCSSALKGGVMG
jgi:YD repeat-containing protein